ncbi:MAG: redox-sensing transcriptional repressor Rex [Christensenellaceae bacterium]|jgi:redox-sensing transcriptional repressor
MGMQKESVSLRTIRRLPLYVNYLKALPAETENISATSIAAGVGLNDVQVRKDLASICSGGRPKTGYNRRKLISSIQKYLGYQNVTTAVLVGMGNLGRALHNYSGFREYGLEIAAAFDAHPGVIGKTYGGHRVMPVSKLRDLCMRMHVHIGIIAVPAESAQAVCDVLIESGIKAIWNFAPVRLRTPEDVLVQNEDMASSLAILSSHLKQKKELER